MNQTEKAALIRGIYDALGMFAVTLLTAYATTDDWRASLITAGIAGLGSLGFRAGVEGIADGKRAREGAVRPSDVGQGLDPMRHETWGV